MNRGDEADRREDIGIHHSLDDLIQGAIAADRDDDIRLVNTVLAQIDGLTMKSSDFQKDLIAVVGEDPDDLVYKFLAALAACQGI